MESIKTIYKIGYGPSSSHTMGPARAVSMFKDANPNAENFEIELYGSLAATGKGHLTDFAIEQALLPSKVKFIWKPEVVLHRHPNALKIKSIGENDEVLSEKIFYSIGGGNIVSDDESVKPEPTYPMNYMTDIVNWCQKEGRTLWEFVKIHEKDDAWKHLEEVWQVMKAAVKRGLEEDGVLPGPIKLSRKASSYYIKGRSYSGYRQRRSMLFAYALAVSEENASGGKVVTAPTCGSCGILPAVLFLFQEFYEFSDEKIIKALATAGLIGNVIRTNGSISGAEVGCQGEVGAACAMAAGAANQLFGGTPQQIEYAAEMGLEHHLGLTCDPVAGLVQVPCIERNAFGASRALDASNFAILSDGKHLVSFDEVISAMLQTGHDLPSLYRETAEGGLAKTWDTEERGSSSI